MEKWIIPTVVALLVILIVWPWLLLILGMVGIIYGFLLTYYNNVLPPPFLSLNTKSEIVINWFSKQNDKTGVILGDPINTLQFPDSQIANEYTKKYQINTCTLHYLPNDQKIMYEIALIPRNLRADPKTPQDLKTAKRIFTGKKYWVRPLKDIYTQKDASLTVAVLGDLQPKSTIPPLFQLHMLRQVKKQDPDLFLFLGDHTMEGIDVRGWIQFYHVLGIVASHTPVLGVPGNHDLKLNRNHGIRLVDAAYMTFTNYPEPKKRYFLSLPSLQIIAFDFTTGFDLSSANYQLLQDALPTIKKEKWTIAIWHSSPYNSLKSDPTTDAVRKNVVPLLDAQGCRLWLGGHEHSYQRFKVNNTYYLTSAATSSFHRHWDNKSYAEKLLLQFHFLRIEFRPQSLQIQAISWRNTIIDILEIEKPAL